MGLFKTRTSDYVPCIHTIRSHLRKNKWDEFSPAVLGLGDVAAPAVEREGVYFVQLVSSLRRAEDGQDLLEYALLVALICLVAVTAVTAAGLKWIALYDAIAAAIPA